MAPSGLLSFLWPDRINNPLVGVKDPEAWLTHTLIGVKTPVIGVKNLHACIQAHRAQGEACIPRHAVHSVVLRFEATPRHGLLKPCKSRLTCVKAGHIPDIPTFSGADSDQLCPLWKGGCRPSPAAVQVLILPTNASCQAQTYPRQMNSRTFWVVYMAALKTG